MKRNPRQSWALDFTPWILDSRHWIPDSLSVKLVFRILIFAGTLESLSCIPNLKTQDSGFHKQKSSWIAESGFSNMGRVINKASQRSSPVNRGLVFSGRSATMLWLTLLVTRCRCIWCDCLPQSNPLNIYTIDARCLVPPLHVCVRSWVCMIFGTKTIAVKREVSLL